MNTSFQQISKTIAGLSLAGVALVSLTFSACEDKAEPGDADKGSEVVTAAPASKSGSAPAAAIEPPAPASDAPKALTSKDKDALKKKLTSIQYDVAVENGTEPSFRNEYWDNKEAGVYVDIISGKPLFASTHKFKSGTGWPSFFQVLDEAEVVEVSDTKYGMVRTEVRSKTGDTHLGHLFPDGPEPTGQRYCINSASLRFVPKDKLAEEGLEQYASLFKGE